MNYPFKQTTILVFFILPSILFAQQIQLVKDVAPGSQSALFFSPQIVGDVVVYGNLEPEYDSELWTTDGTEEGTQLLKNLSENSFGLSFPDYLYSNGDLLFFGGNDQEGLRLFVTDGTEEGTRGIAPDGQKVSVARYFYPFGDRVIFNGSRPETGAEYWISDGTDEGTYLLKDINPGSGGSALNFFTSINYTPLGDQLFFIADNGSGRRLWVTDGTNEGTQMLIGENGDADFWPNLFFHIFNDQLIYSGIGPNHGIEVFVSDGTNEGTQVLLDINPGQANSNTILLGASDSHFYFMNIQDQYSLWKTDGSSSGTEKVKDLDLGELNQFGGFLGSYQDKIYFLIREDSNQNQIWVSDGTSQGTQMLYDVEPGEPSMQMISIGEINNKILLQSIYLSSTGEPSPPKMWALDLTDESLKLLAEIQYNSPYSFLDAPEKDISEFVIDGQFYFPGIQAETGEELWKTDGTPEGTVLIEDFVEGEGSLSPSHFIVYKDQLLFQGVSPETGIEIFSYSPEIVNSTSESNKVDSDFDLYPNPSTAEFHVDLGKPFTSVEVSLIDLQGNTLFAGQAQNTRILTLNPNVTEGIYWVVIKTEEFSGQKLFVKQ